MLETGYSLLSVEPHHAEAIRHLPLHHRDPFDRMLIAQAKVEGLTLMTADPAYRAYDVVIL
jgi:PIN domain nuclease of toxin-antitoxin system